MHDVDRIRLETEMEMDRLGEADELGEAYEEEYGEYEGLLDEVQEMELATELLEVGDEAEFEEFLGRLFRRVRSRVARPMRSATTRALARAMKGVASQAFPTDDGAGPHAIGSTLGLELEGLSSEEQEFEVARQVVRLAADAAGEATELQESQHPAEAARIAVHRAARLHAPGLVTGDRARGPYLQRRRSGRWVRRGRSIVLLDI